jgi:hypothetical protein
VVVKPRGSPPQIEPTHVILAAVIAGPRPSRDSSSNVMPQQGLPGFLRGLPGRMRRRKDRPIRGDSARGGLGPGAIEELSNEPTAPS